MAKLFITLASLSGMLAVVLGAFGAHALRDKLDAYALGIWETAVQYHFYHSLALLAVGIIALSQPQTAMLKASGWLFLLNQVSAPVAVRVTTGAPDMTIRPGVTRIGTPMKTDRATSARKMKTSLPLSRLAPALSGGCGPLILMRDIFLSSLMRTPFLWLIFRFVIFSSANRVH